MHDRRERIFEIEYSKDFVRYEVPPYSVWIRKTYKDEFDNKLKQILE
jgi:hypothetical protein